MRVPAPPRAVMLLLLALFSAPAANVWAQRPARLLRDRPGQTDLSVGDAAPDFKLPWLHDEEKPAAQLSSFRGEKPVALVFGSYT